LPILSRAEQLTIVIRLGEVATLGGVLLACHEVELRTVGFAIRPVLCKPDALVERVFQ